MTFARNESQTAGSGMVSIIMPSYNYGQFVSQTLQSVFAQTYPNWECIIVDDGSTDDTAEVVTRIARDEPRVRYLQQANQRQAAARNTGLANARGDYLQFLDADDLIEASKLERQVAYLEAHPDVDIVYGDVRYFNTHDPTERLHSMLPDNLPWMPQASGKGRRILEPLIRKNIMGVNSPLVRRSLIDRVGLFDVKLPPAEDWDYWLRCAVAGANFQYVDIPDARALVRIHSTSSSQNRLRMYTAAVRIRQKLDALIQDEQMRALNRDLRAADETELGLIKAGSGKSLMATWHFLKSAYSDRRWRWKSKLFACSLLTPFVSERRLRSFIVSSVSGSVKNLGRE